MWALCVSFFWSGRPGSNRPPEAWKASALPNELLPQNKTARHQTTFYFLPPTFYLLPNYLNVGREGFEPPKASPTDLQSAPFDRSGISPFVCAILLGLCVGTSRWTDSNRRPADYKSAALPTELHRQLIGLCQRTFIKKQPFTKKDCKSMKISKTIKENCEKLSSLGCFFLQNVYQK